MHLPKILLSFALNFTVILVLSGTAHSQVLEPRTIYGEDTRKDLFEVTDPEMLRVADSTVALFNEGHLRYDSPTGMVQLFTQPMTKSYNLCPGERFREQKEGSVCSGVLVGRSLVLTAGHCIPNKQVCQQTYFVFGYSIRHPGEFPERVPASEVYGCNAIVMQERDDQGADFALLWLDRPVKGHVPLPINRGERIQPGTSVFSVGHPSGMAAKAVDGGVVRSSDRPGFFAMNLSATGGTSGSPVFNAETKLIEGIIVRGDRDYEPNPDLPPGAPACNVSVRCAANECRGVDATLASSFKKYIPQ